MLALHGKQQQIKRMEVYTDFVRKKSAVLFAMDLAAWAIGFRAVNWVIQFDCPEDANTYIHRVGRTARYVLQCSGILCESRTVNCCRKDDQPRVRLG